MPIDSANYVKTYVTDLWSHNDPGTGSMDYLMNYRNPHLQKPVQLIFKNGESKRTWISGTFYRIEHNVEITAVHNPILYDGTSLETARVTFGNLKNEIDNILLNVLDNTGGLSDNRNYLTTTSHTVNTVTANKFNVINTAAAGSDSAATVGNCQCLWGVDVCWLTEGGASTTLGTKVGLVYRNTIGSGMQSTIWTCPLTNITETGSIYVKYYHNIGGAGWVLGATGSSVQVGDVKNVLVGIFNFDYYTYRDYDGFSTTGTLYWGTNTYRTSIITRYLAGGAVLSSLRLQGWKDEISEEQGMPWLSKQVVTCIYYEGAP